MSISPTSDPIYPAIAPMVQRECTLYGAEMAYELSTAGRRGILIGDVRWSDYPITTFYSNARLHNVCGMLTESADVAIARPIYIESDTRRGVVTSANPDPFEGGMWHLSDIVSQIRIASEALLSAMARDPVKVLKNMARKALSQTARGANSEEKFYLIPKEQHDPSARHRLLGLMKKQEIELYELSCDLAIGGRVYCKGTVAVPLAQPYFAAVDVFCNARPFPINEFMTRDKFEMPLVTEDASVCVALGMGVEVIAAGEDISRDALKEYCHGEYHCSLSANENESYVEVNRRLSAGERVWRLQNGDFDLSGTKDGAPVPRRRIGLYKSRNAGNGGNEEEGFTRNMLRRGGFDYRIVHQDELCSGRVPDVDVLIFAGESYKKLSGVPTPPRGVVNGYVTLPDVYYEGLGEVGDKTLRRFIEEGGRVLAWTESALYLSEHLGLSISFPSWSTRSDEFSTLGSHVRICYSESPLTLGLPKKSTVFHRAKTVFEIAEDGAFEVFARYAEHDVLANGFLIGEKYLAGKPAALRTRLGNGELILLGFDPQFRLQQDVSFKLIFNTFFL